MTISTCVDLGRYISIVLEYFFKQFYLEKLKVFGKTLKEDFHTKIFLLI